MPNAGKPSSVQELNDQLNPWVLADKLCAQWEGILHRLKEKNEQLLVSESARYSEQEREQLLILIEHMAALASNIRGKRQRKVVALRKGMVAAMQEHDRIVAMVPMAALDTPGSTGEDHFITV